MKKFAYLICCLALILIAIAPLSGCSEVPATGGTSTDISSQKQVADKLASSQNTPTDIEYSLERYNLIRRTYWVNGQREKANTLPCEVEKPLSYIVLFSGNTTVGSFVVDGKVSSLNSFLTPSAVDSTDWSSAGITTITTEMADVDGSYGENDSGIFFFTPDGNYYEWTGTYLYSDVPFIIEDPVVKVVN